MTAGGRPVVVCGCGRSYTLAEFRELGRLVVQVIDDGQRPERLECRQCECGSHRGIWTDLDGRLVDDEGGLIQ